MLSYSPILSLVKLSIVKVSLKISLTANCLLLCLGVSECIFAFWPLFLDFFFAIVQSTMSVSDIGFGNVFSGLEVDDTVEFWRAPEHKEDSGWKGPATVVHIDHESRRT